MQEFDDLKAVVTAALAKIQAGKDTQALLAVEQAAHTATKDTLASVLAEITELKGQLTTALAG